jgi:putative hemolysin
VQDGITVAGLLAGAFSGAALGERLASGVAGFGLDHVVSEAIGYGVIITLMTYLSVIIGELVPKHVALRDPESIACAVAPLMGFLSRLAGPTVWLLDASTRLVFRILGQKTAAQRAITDEEIGTILAEAETAGTIETAERRMIAASNGASSPLETSVGQVYRF